MGPSLNESGLYLHRLDGVVAFNNMQDEEIVNGCLQRQKLASRKAWLLTIYMVRIRLSDCQGEGGIVKMVFVSFFLARGSKKGDIHTLEVVSKFKACCQISEICTLMHRVVLPKALQPERGELSSFLSEK